jgi:hypothetical protein
MYTLNPKEKLLHLAHSKNTVNVVYLDAKPVFASILTCPISKHAKHFLFHGNSPFSCPPDKFPFIGDINASHGYMDSHNRLVTIPAVDVLLPCILAMDKTHCHTFGRLHMEPIAISYGLMKHSIFCSCPMAMRRLGFSYHFETTALIGFFITVVQPICPIYNWCHRRS